MPRKAAKPGTVSKANSIREYIAANPTAKVSEVVAGLKEKGVKVLANHVYVIKSKGKTKARRARKVERIATAGKMGFGNPVAAITQVRTLANNLGGMKQLRDLVDVLMA